ncbi:MAG: ATP-binding protein, partial [Defluviitaleaceae bacterium]|nr:ATP-binding protein [Defluviitaleaceae bacterium]
MNNEVNNANYDESNIQILEGLEAVRKRPGMYIGSTSSRGLHHLVYEIVDNAVDEALAGFCREITVTIHEGNTISVLDDGRGIPIGVHADRGIPAVEVVFTILHAGGKFGGGGYKVSGGLHGVGASVVNALSEWTIVQIHKENKIHEIKFERGDKVQNLTIVGDTNKTGTFVHFKPDAEIFEETIYDFEILRARLQETAFLTKGLKINLIDSRLLSVEKNEEGQQISKEQKAKMLTFHYEGGIKEFVSHINKNKTPIFEEVLYVEKETERATVEVAMQYNDGYVENTYSYVNNINTVEGGTHLSGFRTALTKSINDYARKYNLVKENEKNLSGDDVREGLTSIISIKLEEPQFEGQTKGKLGTSEAKQIVDSAVSEFLEYYLEENPNISKIIVEKALTASRAREAAKKARELVRRKNVLDIA